MTPQQQALFDVYVSANDQYNAQYAVVAATTQPTTQQIEELQKRLELAREALQAFLDSM